MHKWGSYLSTLADDHLDPFSPSTYILPTHSQKSTPMEIVSLVLAVVPVCLQGVYAMDDGSRRFRNYRRSVEDVARQLEVEKLKLENTFEQLLGNIVSSTELARLLTGEGWDENICRKLIQHLGEKSMRIFVINMESLGLVVLELAGELGIQPGFVVRGPYSELCAFADC